MAQANEMLGGFVGAVLVVHLHAVVAFGIVFKADDLDAVLLEIFELLGREGQIDGDETIHLALAGNAGDDAVFGLEQAAGAVEHQVVVALAHFVLDATQGLENEIGGEKGSGNAQRIGALKRYGAYY